MADVLTSSQTVVRFTQSCVLSHTSRMKISPERIKIRLSSWIVSWQPVHWVCSFKDTWKKKNEIDIFWPDVASDPETLRKYIFECIF